MLIGKSEIRLVKFACYATILGYWYNLPVITTGVFGGYNEFRLYDLTFLIFFYMLSIKSRSSFVFSYLNSHKILSHLFKFVKWSTIMIVPTFISAIWYSKYSYIGMSVIFLFHLWGFLLLVTFVNLYLEEIDFERQTRWFLTLSTAHLFLYYLQIEGAVGHLWPEVYQETYGDSIYSGTLGPNRITPGMMTFFGFVLSLYSIFNTNNLKGMKLIGIVNISLAIPVILMVGSRTTFFSLIFFLLVFVIFYARKYIFVLLLIVPVVVVSFEYIGGSQKNLIIYNFEKNQNKLLRGESLDNVDLAEGYSNLGSGRKEILDGYIPYLLDNSFIIPLGMGFNNRLYAIQNTGAASAHNIYLSLINEVGLVGLFFYLSWLFSYIRTSRLLIKQGGNTFIFGLTIALVVAMLISLFSGEHLYVYRPCFALLGTFIFVMNVILNHSKLEAHSMFLQSKK